MKDIKITDSISYIEATDDPLSADIGIVRGADGVWLFDVGNGTIELPPSDDGYSVVLSHFHADHTGNVDKIHSRELYVSGETLRHVGRGTVVDRSVCFGNLRVFPLPSCHAKGCLALEVDGKYTFVGDALYSKFRDGYYIYNAQLLKDEIAALEALRSPYLLVSHYKGLMRDKDEVLKELKEIYGMRKSGDPEIKIKADRD